MYTRASLVYHIMPVNGVPISGLRQQLLSSWIRQLMIAFIVPEHTVSITTMANYLFPQPTLSLSITSPDMQPNVVSINSKSLDEEGYHHVTIPNDNKLLRYLRSKELCIFVDCDDHYIDYHLLSKDYFVTNKFDIF